MAHEFTPRTCRCGVVFMGRARAKWHSDLCRKQHLYSGRCVDCGGPTTGTSAGQRRAPKRCRSCAMDVQHDLLRARWLRRAGRLIDLRRQGMLNIQVDELLALPGGTAARWFYRMRQLGIDVPLTPYHASKPRKAMEQLAQPAGCKPAVVSEDEPARVLPPRVRGRRPKCGRCGDPMRQATADMVCGFCMAEESEAARVAA